MARVFVAVDDEIEIVGFYSLGAFTLTLESLPDEIACKLPRYDAIPAALIGRLARNEKVRGREIGELLLADALRRILGASKTLAVFASRSIPRMRARSSSTRRSAFACSPCSRAVCLFWR